MGNDKSFGEALRQARKASKLSAREVGLLVGVSTTFIYDIEKSRKNATLETITKLADVYDSPELVSTYKEIKNIPEIEITYRMADVLHAFRNFEYKDDEVSEDDVEYKKARDVRNMLAHGQLEKVLEKDPNAFDEVIEYLNRKLKDLVKEDGE